MDQMKVLQILSNIKRNGPASVALDLCRNLPENCEVYVASAGGELEPSFEEKGAHSVILPIGRITNKLFYIPNFFRTLQILDDLVKRQKIDVIHCHQPIPIIFGRILRLRHKIPLITTAHNMYNPNSYFNKQYGKGNRVAAVSDRVRQDQIKNFSVNPDIIQTIINGIDENRKVISKTREQIRKEFNIPSDAFVVCTIAGLRKQKALDVLLRAAKKVVLEEKNIFFILAGDGSEKESLLALHKDLELNEKFKFVGFRDDVYNLLNASDLFCLSSDYEGLPISILEAMLCEKPTVATDVGGVSEVLSDGRTGIICEKQNSEQIAKAILKIYREIDTRLYYSTEAKEDVDNKFSARLMANKYYEMYEKVLNN